MSAFYVWSSCCEFTELCPSTNRLLKRKIWKWNSHCAGKVFCYKTEYEVTHDCLQSLQNSTALNLTFLCENWNNILRGVQEHIKLRHPKLYEIIVVHSVYYKYTIFDIIKRSKAFKTQEAIYEVIIEFLCYID